MKMFDRARGQFTMKMLPRLVLFTLLLATAALAQQSQQQQQQQPQQTQQGSNLAGRVRRFSGRVRLGTVKTSAGDDDDKTNKGASVLPNCVDCARSSSVDGTVAVVDAVTVRALANNNNNNNNNLSSVLINERATPQPTGRQFGSDDDDDSEDDDDDDEEGDGTALEEGRKKKKKGMGKYIMAMAGFMKAALLYMKIHLVAMLAGKALVIAKVALAIAVAVALKKSLGHKTSYEIVKHPHYSHSHTPSQSVDYGDHGGGYDRELGGTR